MHDVGQHRPIHLFIFVPVCAVQVWDIEIVALIAPAFIEDLFELFFGIEVHAQRKVDASGSGLRRVAIGINHEQRRNWWPPAECGAASTTASTAGAEYQLAAVSADVVISDALDKGGRAPIAETVTNQLAAAATALAATAALSCTCRLQIKYNSVSA